jgi:predicted phosphodiesterase
MRKIRFIGDIHGKFNLLSEFVKNVETPVIQIGDLGIGFGVNPKTIPCQFIRGNHDNLQECKQYANFIQDGSFLNNMFFVGGALSIDKDSRIEGKNWWRDEEIGYNDWNQIIDNYSNIKPDFVVSHDCPKIANPRDFCVNSMTQNGLSELFSIHHPKIWIFGHHHIDFDKVIDGTRFICVNQDSFIDLEF